MKNISDCVYPCPCGHFGDTQKACTFAPAVVTKYQKRISGPLLDRIDIHIEVPRVDYEKLSGDRLGETSESIRKRVQAARDIQTQRYSHAGTMSSTRNSNNESSAIVCNADMRIGEVRQFCSLQPEGQSLMRAAMSQLNLSARLSSHPQVITHHRRLGWKRRDTVSTLGGGAAISPEDHDRVKFIHH